MSTQMYNAKASKARRDARRKAGLCISCGKEKRSGISSYNGRVYQTCQRCFDIATRNSEKYRIGKRVESPDAPVTTTGAHYLVPATNVIGKIQPCNCDNPIILEFADKSLDYFWLKEITLTDLPVTLPQKKKTGRRGFQKATIKKMIAIHSFLMRQNQAVSHLTIKQKIRSDCTPQLRGLSGSDQWNLEQAKIVSRTKRGKDYFWELTEFGRAEGLAVIESLKGGHNGKHTMDNTH